MMQARTVKAVTALMAGAMLAGQAQPQAQVQPQSRPALARDWAQVRLPTTQALFDG